MQLRILQTDANEFRPRSSRRRRGSAPLELMVAMPLLVWLIAAILNAGAGGVATADATIAARVDAFRKAERHTTPTERLFFLSPEIAGLDVQTASAERSRSVPPALGTTQLTGRASLAVFNNVWDRREMPLNDPVHLRLIGQASAGSVGGQIVGPAMDALNGLQRAGDSARNTLDEIGAKGQELNREPAEITAAREQEAAQRRANAARAAELQKQADAEKAAIAELDTKIREQDAALEQAKKDFKDDEEGLKKREDEINAIKKPLETERTARKEKLKNIEGEIKILKQAS